MSVIPFDPNSSQSKEITNNLSVSHSAFPEMDFLQALQLFGLQVNDSIKTGCIVRVNHNDKPGKKTGWYLYFGVDPVSGIAGGVYGDWRFSDQWQHWSSRTQQDVTTAQWRDYQTRIEKQKALAREEKNRLQNEAAEHCQQQWESAQCQNEHLYLTRKAISPQTIRCTQNNALLVPMYNRQGVLRNVQRIYPNGDKYFCDRAQVLGCYHQLGDCIGECVYIVEGYATGETVRDLTQETVFVAFNTSNLTPVAMVVRELYPQTCIIIAADNDRHTTGNPGATYAKKAAMAFYNTLVCIPQFTSEQGSDFNDLVIQEGTDIARKQLTKAVNSSAFCRAIYDAGMVNVEGITPRDWVYDRLLLAGYISVQVAPGGTGKSIIALVMAISVAVGKPLLDGHTVKRARNVLVINNEDDNEELHRRIAAICLYFGIDLNTIKKRLFIGSGYDSPLVIATQTEPNKVMETLDCHRLVEFTRINSIELIVAEPFSSLHQLPENDNMLQNEVIRVCRRVCAKTQAALLLIAHTKKLGGDSEIHAGDAESLRGATAIKDGARVAFTLARMSKKTAENQGIDVKLAASLVRIDDAKRNFSHRDDKVKWLSLVSVKLPNGDSVGVPCSVELDDVSVVGKRKNQTMTGCEFAEIIEKYAGSDILCHDEFLFSEIKQRLAEATKLGISTLGRYASLLSRDEKNPSRIKKNSRLIDYWVSKKIDKKTIPLTIHRKELN